MKTMRAKLYLACSLLCLGVLLAVLAPVPKAFAAGESYSWSGDNFEGNGGVYQNPPTSASAGLYSDWTDGVPRFSAAGGSSWRAVQRVGYTYTRPTDVENRQIICYIQFNVTLTAVNLTDSPGAPVRNYSTGTINASLSAATGGGLTQNDVNAACESLVGLYNNSLTDQITIGGTAPASAVAAPSGSNEPVSEEDFDDICSQNAGELFMVCPFSEGLMNAAMKLDEWIVGLIKIDTSEIFGGPGASSSEQQSSDSFRIAWNAFRNIAYVLLVIIGLIMVLSQVIGLDIFDAYTVRKMLPRLVVATIAIPLMWPFLSFVFNMSNAAADAVMSLIITPFMNIPGIELGTMEGVTRTSVTLASIAVLPAVLTAGVAFLWLGGWGVGLALLASVALAVLSAFFILLARDVIAFVLIIVSSIAILCATFEPLRKAFTLWRTLLITILLSIPAVAAVLAASKVAAAIAMLTNPEFGSVLGLIFIIIGYALFWTVFKAIDKVSGQLGNIVSRATGGLRKGLSEYREDALSRRWKETMSGQRPVGRFGRAVGLGVAADVARRMQFASQPGGSFKGARAAMAQQAIIKQSAAEMVKADDGRSGGNDDAMEAIGAAYAKYGEKGDLNKAREILTARKMQQAQAKFRSSQLDQGVRYENTDEGREKFRRDFQADYSSLGPDGKSKATKDFEGATEELQQAESSFRGKIGTASMALAATTSLFNSNTSLRKEGWGRTAQQGLEAGREILQGLQNQKLITQTDAGAIFTSNKARADRSGAGFAAGMQYVDTANVGGTKTSTSKLLRTALEGSGPGALIGQRWEAVQAAAPELAKSLDDAAKASSKFTQTDAARIRTNVIQDLQQAAQAAGQAFNPAEAQRQAEAAVQQAQNQVQSNFVDQVASLDALYKLTGQVSRKNAGILRDEVLSKNYTFNGQTKTGEQWTRDLDADPVLGQKYREARFSYSNGYAAANGPKPDSNPADGPNTGAP